MPSARILVTGASGFIGAHLVRWLARCGRDTRAAVRKNSSSDSTSVEVVAVGNIDRATDWTRALRGIDVVVHLAGRAHVLDERSPAALERFREVNVEGTMRLAAQAADRVRRLVFVSSIGVNGSKTTDRPFSESSPPAPVEDYAKSKYEAEQELRALSERTGLELVIVRPPLVYGPGCPGNFLRLIRLVNSGLPLPIASIRNSRSLIFVENLASALLACAEHPLARGQTYLVDDGETMSTPELARTLGKLLGKQVRLVPFPLPILRLLASLVGRASALDKLGDSLVVDGAAIRRDLGWKPHRTMQDGLAETVRWYRDTVDRQSSGASPC